MLENGFIKLHRNILKWEWYDDVNTKTVFIHLLLTASIESSKWHGETIKRGERVCSRASLAKELNIPEQAVRTSLKRLQSTNELTIRTTRKYSVVTINNYEKYQETPNSLTNKRPTANQQPTSCQPQYKKVKEDSKKVKEKNGASAQNSEDEIERLKAELRK